MCVATSSPLNPNRCATCCRRLDGPDCTNPVCSWNPRNIRTVYALAARTGAIEAVLKAFKYDEGQAGWGVILGRIIVGWLEHKHAIANQYSLITVNPTHPDRTPIRHTEQILAAAKKEDQLGWWPLDDPDDTALRKHTETASATTYGTSWWDKKRAADELCGAVEVVDEDRVRDKTILVVDDVTTTLLQLDVIAGILMRAGATAVDGLVIARQGG